MKNISSFNKNIAALVTGTAISQIISILLIPLLTRLYTPSDFGILAIFISISTIVSSIATGRYELAIADPVEEKDAYNIAGLAFIISTIFSIAVLLIVIAILQSTGIFKSDAVGSPSWLIAIPIFIWLQSICNIANYLLARERNFSAISVSNASASVTLAISQIAMGLASLGSFGLISGQIVSRFTASVAMAKKSKLLYQMVNNCNSNRIKSLALKYIDFPKYTMWTGLINTATNYIILFFVSALYSITTVGLYSFATRLVNLPLALVGGPIGQIYFQHATEEARKTGKAGIVFNKTLIKLITISTILYGILFYFSGDIFTKLFGPEWAVSSRYARLLIPFFAIRLVSSSLSQTCTVFYRQHHALIINISILICNIAVIIVSFSFSLSIDSMIILYSSTLSILYIIFGVHYYRLAHGKYS